MNFFEVIKKNSEAHDEKLQIHCGSQFYYSLNFIEVSFDYEGQTNFTKMIFSIFLTENQCIQKLVCMKPIWHVCRGKI